jgi:hypothetical protein
MECAVLFADVAGSTALYEVLGDERAFALVEKCLSIMSDCTDEARGRVVKTIGDAVLSVFQDADAAAAAAIEMQTEVDALGPTVGGALFDHTAGHPHRLWWTIAAIGVGGAIGYSAIGLARPTTATPTEPEPTPDPDPAPDPAQPRVRP